MSIDPVARGMAAKALAGSGSAPGGSNSQVQYNNSGAFGGAAQLFWDSIKNQLGLGNATPSALLDLKKTQNEAGLSITGFAPDGGSSGNLAEFRQSSGQLKTAINEAGAIQTNAWIFVGGATNGDQALLPGTWMMGVGSDLGANTPVGTIRPSNTLSDPQPVLSSRLATDGTSMGWALFSTGQQWWGPGGASGRGNGDDVTTQGFDTGLSRLGAGVLAQVKDGTAQHFEVYQTRTDASNGAWFDIDLTTAGKAILSTNGNGTGASTLGQLQVNILGVNKLDYGVTTAGIWASATDFKINGITAGLGGGASITNTGFGRSSFASNTSGTNNAAFGVSTLTANTSGSNNSAFGYGSLAANTTGGNNSSFGQNALTANTSGSTNDAFGYNALNKNTTGGNSSAFGSTALTSNTSGNNNGAFGFNALASNTVGSNNDAFGLDALLSNTTGANNVAFGVYSLFKNSTGNNNSGYGYQSIYSNTTGAGNAAHGPSSLYSNTTGNNNSSYGFQSLYDLGSAVTAGSFATGVSYTILTVGTTDFTAIGASANTVGIVFTATGAGTGTGTATPNGTNSNTAVGYNTGRGILSGINNTILGAQVGSLPANLSGAIIIATGDGTIRADFGKTNAGAWTFAAPSVLPVYTIAQLLALTPVIGMCAYVSDTVASAAATWHGTVTAGGSTTVASRVSYNGSVWQYD